MVRDIEECHEQHIDQIDWMSPATKLRAREKLAAVANKIGYPDKWRLFKLAIAAQRRRGNQMRSEASRTTASSTDRPARRPRRVADDPPTVKTPTTTPA